MGTPTWPSPPTLTSLLMDTWDTDTPTPMDTEWSMERGRRSPPTWSPTLTAPSPPTIPTWPSPLTLTSLLRDTWDTDTPTPTDTEWSTERGRRSPPTWSPTLTAPSPPTTPTWPSP